MATHGQQSWALTSLGAWRDRSLSTEKSLEFVKRRQREAKRALLRAASVPPEGVINSDPTFTTPAADPPREGGFP